MIADETHNLGRAGIAYVYTGQDLQKVATEELDERRAALHGLRELLEDATFCYRALPRPHGESYRHAPRAAARLEEHVAQLSACLSETFTQVSSTADALDLASVGYQHADSLATNVMNCAAPVLTAGVPPFLKGVAMLGCGGFGVGKWLWDRALRFRPQGPSDFLSKGIKAGLSFFLPPFNNPFLLGSLAGHALNALGRKELRVAPAPGLTDIPATMGAGVSGAARMIMPPPRCDGSVVSRAIGIHTVVRDGHEAVLVTIPGVEIPSGSSPFNITSAALGGTGWTSHVELAVVEALEQAGVDSSTPIALVGHSLGGLTALNLASDKSFVERYNLKSAASVGTPGGLLIARPEVPFLQFESTNDMAMGVDTSTNKLHDNGTLIMYNGIGFVDPLSAHNIDSYLPGLESADAMVSAALVDYREASAEILGPGEATVTSTYYVAELARPGAPDTLIDAKPDNAGYLGHCAVNPPPPGAAPTPSGGAAGGESGQSSRRDRLNIAP